MGHCKLLSSLTSAVDFDDRCPSACAVRWCYDSAAEMQTCECRLLYRYVGVVQQFNISWHQQSRETDQIPDRDGREGGRVKEGEGRTNVR